MHTCDSWTATLHQAGINTGILWYKKNPAKSQRCCCSKLLTRLGSPSGPLQSKREQESKLYDTMLNDHMLNDDRRNTFSNKDGLMRQPLSVVCVTYRDSLTHTCLSDFLPWTGHWDKNSLQYCSGGRLLHSTHCAAKQKEEKKQWQPEKWKSNNCARVEVNFTHPP